MEWGGPVDPGREEDLVGLVDLLVVAVVALAALRGWRRGGTGLVLRAAGAVAGVLVASALAGWWDATSLPLAVGAAIVGGLLGWAVGRRVGEALAVRTRGAGRRSAAELDPGQRAAGHPRRPGLPDRLLGVVAHAGLALVLSVLAAGALAAVGPPAVGDAAARSAVLTATAQRVPAPAELLGPALGEPLAAALDRVPVLPEETPR